MDKSEPKWLGFVCFLFGKTVFRCGDTDIAIKQQAHRSLFMRIVRCFYLLMSKLFLTFLRQTFYLVAFLCNFGRNLVTDYNISRDL